MDSSKSFFRKYFISGMVIFLTFIAINLGLIVGILTFFSGLDTNINTPISIIADSIRVNEQGAVLVEEEAMELLSKETSWAMILDDSGTVIWENDLPNDLSRQYTSSDIAQFSRWYLKDYPVLVQVITPGSVLKGKYFSH